MLWIKINSVSYSRGSILLPMSMAHKMPDSIQIKYGLRVMNVTVCSSPDLECLKNNSFSSPLFVELCKNIIDELLIEDSVVYQMIYSQGIIHIGPVIGLLLGRQSFFYHNMNMSGFTRGMEIYSELGGLFIAFNDSSIDWDNMVINGLYYYNKIGEWKYGTFPLPSVVFRRAFNTKQIVIDKLKKLTGNKVFNSKRTDKWELHKILLKDKKFNKYLPETSNLSNTDIFENFTNKYSKVVLKPTSLSRGRGICFVQKMDNYFSVYSYKTPDKPEFHTVEGDKMHQYLLDNNYINKNYIIQPQIEMAKINGAPFDIRIVMHKSENGKWQCSGIECRLAKPGSIITNISRGGQALSIKTAVQLSLGPFLDVNKIKRKVISIAKHLCTFMDNTGEHYAEFGLDFAIDTKIHYWFIELNIRPVFRGFKKLSYKNYLHIRHKPLLYAAALAGFEKRMRKNEPKV